MEQRGLGAKAGREISGLSHLPRRASRQRRQSAHQLAEDDAQLLHLSITPLVVADWRADEDHASQPPDVLAPDVVR